MCVRSRIFGDLLVLEVKEKWVNGCCLAFDRCYCCSLYATSLLRVIGCILESAARRSGRPVRI